MLHTSLVETIKADRQRDSFLYPYYGKYSIADVGPSILAYLGAPNGRATLPEDFLPKGYNRILLFMVDGFGLDHFQEYQHQVPVLNRLAQASEIYPITSVFPSTTPAALTAIHTGITPQEHGLPEWTVYFEEFGSIIETFPFKPIMSAQREELLQMGGTPQMLYDGPTVYSQLKDADIPSYVFISHEYGQSPYSRMVQQGSTVIPFIDYQDLFVKLRERLRDHQEPGYFFVYWSHIDSIQHVFGPRSPEHLSAMQSFSTFMTDHLFSQMQPQEIDDLLFLMMADHGHTSIKGEDIIFLNNYLPLEQSYLHSPSKKSIQPTGSPHDVFLHIYKPRIQETLEYLKKELDGKAEVITTMEAIGRGLFGLNQPTQRFLKRIGDILILPYPGTHVWYKHDPAGHYGNKGIHGGLTEAEMLTPFVVAPFADLCG